MWVFLRRIWILRIFQCCCRKRRLLQSWNAKAESVITKNDKKHDDVHNFSVRLMIEKMTEMWYNNSVKNNKKGFDETFTALLKFPKIYWRKILNWIVKIENSFWTSAAFTGNWCFIFFSEFLYFAIDKLKSLCYNKFTS